MRDATIDVSTPDGSLPVRLFYPDAPVPAPLVIFYMDAFGVRETLATMARRIASDGYVVALPDLYYRAAPVAPFDVKTAFTTPGEGERIMALIRGLSAAGVMSDTQALITALEDDDAVDTRTICTVGYCMGGGYALRAAGTFPDRVVAAASYHGGHLATGAPDSPDAVAARAKGRLYVGYAENDRSFPEAQRAALEASLSAAHVPHEIELYHARHGFAVPDHAVYDEAAAARHWATLLPLFARATGKPSADR
jgi:carboxymethylenebutenolidase